MPATLTTCFGDYDDVVAMTCDPDTGVWTGNITVNGVGIIFTVTANPWTITLAGSCFAPTAGTITQTVCDPPGFAWEVAWDQVDLAGCPGCGIGLLPQKATAGGAFMVTPIQQLWGWHV